MWSQDCDLDPAIQRLSTPTTLAKKRKYKHRRTTQPLTTDPTEVAFKATCEKLVQLLCRFHARDVYASLLVSQLWLPNCSAQIKHALAISLFASLDATCFRPTRRIQDYDCFCAFVTELHALLPPFPLLEDYVPESDWGEIKLGWGEPALRVFYGGTAERITDFIEAFRMRHLPGGPEMRDMDCALVLQDRLSTLIEHPAIADEEAIDPGSLHMPSETFWQQSTHALSALANLARELHVSTPLLLRAGTLSKVSGHRTFERRVLTGRVLPYLLIDIDGERLPLCPRDAAITVITFWAKRCKRDPPLIERRLAATLAPYLGNRLREAVTGRFRLALRGTTRRHLEACALIAHESSLWVICVVSPDRLNDLARIDRDLQATVLQDGAVIVLDRAINDLIVFKPRASTALDVASVKLIVLIADTGITNRVVRFPRSSARVFFLTDFISITQSIIDSAELLSFFTFLDMHPEARQTPLVGLVDLFAMFRHSHGLLVEGAVRPDLIFLDPHAGSRWRFDEQRTFWAQAPARFPDDDPMGWKIDPSQGADRLIQLIHRGRWQLSWVAELPTSSAHFLFDFKAQSLSESDGRVLETFVHCAADTLNQRQDLVASILLPPRVITYCLSLVPNGDIDEGSLSLLSLWEVMERNDATLRLRVAVDLEAARRGFMDAKDAAFEVEILEAWLSGVAAILGPPLPPSVAVAIRTSAQRRARFVYQEMRRPVDVPDHPSPLLPVPKQYKTARRDLAEIFEAQGVQPGRFELADAKAIIDPARLTYSTRIRAMLARFARIPLLLFLVEQFDALVAEYDGRVRQLTMSLTHEVDFDRQGELAQAHEAFVTHARNYRYLLEFVYSETNAGHEVPTSEDITSVLAQVDWLMVLHQASDTLHHAIDVGGITLSLEWIPEVFYATDDHDDYQRELADERLRAGTPVDELSRLSDLELAQLNEAFAADAGFTLTHLLHALVILSRWPSVNGRPEDLHLSYRAPDAQLIDTFVAAIPDLTTAAASRVLEFLILRADRVRVLSDREIAEQDVPTWEHRKRDYRYGLRPLLRLGEKELVWGAAAAERAHRIWAGSLSDGYLPAELPWPHVNTVSANVKKRIERELELRAFEICQRHATRVLHGVDLRRRFPNEAFPEVGDFDVLAFAPERNEWLTVECKYNKPAFCLKDARRLREYIFGKSSAGGYVGKIAQRRALLAQHAERVRVLLGWPEPPGGIPSTIVDLYVCPRIFFWMRSPPYPTSVQFVRLALLDQWLRQRLDERSQRDIAPDLDPSSDW